MENQIIAHIIDYFEQYGYWTLFIGLMLEFIALPIPGETMMCFSGYLAYMGKFEVLKLIAVAFLGTTIGMTITYWVGFFLGMPFVVKYGKWLFLTPTKIEKTQRWFKKYGYSLLFIGYFIPGVRHFTGYFSGILRLPFRYFALYAYLGALFWVIVFILIGKIFGPKWEQIFEQLGSELIKLGIAIFVVIVLFFAYKYVRAKYFKK